MTFEKSAGITRNAKITKSWKANAMILIFIKEDKKN